MCTLQCELEGEKEKDHREWCCRLDLSQPVGDSVWGEMPGGNRDGRLPRLTVRKLIKLLAHCEGGEGWRIGSSSLQEETGASYRTLWGEFSTFKKNNKKKGAPVMPIRWCFLCRLLIHCPFSFPVGSESGITGEKKQFQESLCSFNHYALCEMWWIPHVCSRH